MALSTNNEPLRLALDAIPEVAEARKVHLRFRQEVARRKVRPVAQAAGIAAEVRKAAYAGDPLPADISTQFAAAHLEAKYGRAEEALLLDGILSELTANVDSAIRSNVDLILTHLNTQLQKLLDEARPNHAAVGRLDAEGAVRVDKSREWKDLQRSVVFYGEIRKAQATVHRDVLNEQRDALWWVIAYLANPLTVWPDLPMAIRYGGARVNANGDPVDGQGYPVESRSNAAPLVAPWPGKPWGASDYGPKDHEAYLRWALDTPDAELWVPDTEQLADARAEVNQAVHNFGQKGEKKAARSHPDAPRQQAPAFNDPYGKTTVIKRKAGTPR